VVKKMDIHALREDYKQGELRRKDLHDDPFKQFEKWFQQACNAELLEPNAMTLSTVSVEGQPFMDSFCRRSAIYANGIAEIF